MGALGVLSQPAELIALVKLKGKVRSWKRRTALQDQDADWKFCFEILNKVSRSFALVIQQLGDELRFSVCVFYLVLRALDTVEDDMAIQKDTKAQILQNFHKSIEKDGFTLSCGYKDERLLMENFDHVVRAFRSLKPEYQASIQDITRRMAEGMHLFMTKNVESKADYDLYCHYVAGLVGIGLSRLFCNSGLEDMQICKEEHLANHMGLFLQKTNIIRDFLEDHEDMSVETGERRVFWPEEVWRKHIDSLSEFTYGKNPLKAVACLNEMVADALQHVPHCVQYLSAIRTEENFVFCAIPQVMAAHTLAMCYNNPKVFQGQIRKHLGECRNLCPVKLRRGQAARLMLETRDMNAVVSFLEKAMDRMQDKIPNGDASSIALKGRIQDVRDVIRHSRIDLHPSPKKPRAQSC